MNTADVLWIVAVIVVVLMVVSLVFYVVRRCDQERRKRDKADMRRADAIEGRRGRT
ncbi:MULTISPECIES: hypothetical protein [unclassified Cryobacterium]|uniref:hypothetical protein n=1 Tax=unclassified Cryobacterium TaxID=2649013 RepID=UPI001304C8ED|nr:MULTISPECIES: hypothetical protein [unclassified Cryobacterium]